MGLLFAALAVVVVLLCPADQELPSALPYPGWEAAGARLLKCSKTTLAIVKITVRAFLYRMFTDLIMIHPRHTNNTIAVSITTKCFFSIDRSGG